MKNLKVKPVVFQMAQELARDLRLRNADEVANHLIEKMYKESRLRELKDCINTWLRRTRREEVSSPM